MSKNIYSMNTEEHTPTADELAAETEAQSEVSADDVRAKLITDLGIEENESNKDMIDKMVTRDVESRSRLSKAIGQKISLRDQISGKKPEVKTPAKKSTDGETADPAEAARNAAREEFMQRDLDDMSHSDALKAEIKDIAERKGISIRKAEQDSYIQFQIGEETRQQKVNNAAKNGKAGAKSSVSVDVTQPLDPADFNFSTEEGRAEWDEARLLRSKARD